MKMMRTLSASMADLIAPGKSCKASQASVKKQFSSLQDIASELLFLKEQCKKPPVIQPPSNEDLKMEYPPLGLVVEVRDVDALAWGYGYEVSYDGILSEDSLDDVNGIPVKWRPIFEDDYRQEPMKLLEVDPKEYNNPDYRPKYAIFYHLGSGEDSGNANVTTSTKYISTKICVFSVKTTTAVATVSSAGTTSASPVSAPAVTVTTELIDYLDLNEDQNYVTVDLTDEQIYTQPEVTVGDFTYREVVSYEVRLIDLEEPFNSIGENIFNITSTGSSNSSTNSKAAAASPDQNNEKKKLIGMLSGKIPPKGPQEVYISLNLIDSDKVNRDKDEQAKRQKEEKLRQEQEAREKKAAAEDLQKQTAAARRKSIAQGTSSEFATTLDSFTDDNDAKYDLFSETVDSSADTDDADEDNNGSNDSDEDQEDSDEDNDDYYSDDGDMDYDQGSQAGYSDGNGDSEDDVVDNMAMNAKYYDKIFNLPSELPIGELHSCVLTKLAKAPRNYPTVDGKKMYGCDHCHLGTDTHTYIYICTIYCHIIPAL
jgi:hypothetical protein